MAKKGLFVVFGPPGGGKSTEALTTFQDALYLASAPNNGHYYTHWLTTQEGRASGKRPPTAEIVIDLCGVNGAVEFGSNGMPMRKPQLPVLEMYLNEFVRLAAEAHSKKQPLKYKNLIIDEIGTFWGRVYEEILPTSISNSGKIDTRGAYGLLTRWSTERTNLLRQVLQWGANVCVVAHDQEPEMQEDKKGGPKLPGQATQKQLCADADGVLMRRLKDAEIDVNNPGASKPARRIWQAFASENWNTKMRGLGHEVFDRLADMSLADIVREAGFEP